MSAAGDILRQIAVAAANEAFEWAVDKVRGKAREAGIDVDDAAARSLIESELAVLYATMRALAVSIDADLAKLDESERKFRESPNVEVVDVMTEHDPDR